jgi:hypothetical protein
MSNARATKRPNGKPAPAKARQAPPTSARAAPEKNSTLLKSAGDKPVHYKPTNAGKGRVKGVPNAITKSAREIFSAFIEGNAAKVQELFDRVARKSPAKALSIYAKLAEFVIPKLQRTELSGQLNHGVFAGEVLTVTDPVEAARVYQEVIMGKRDAASVKIVSAPEPAKPSPYVALRSTATLQHQPAPEPRFEQDPEPIEKRRPENVIVLEHACSLPEHQPIVDSKCAFCRQLWVKERERAEDAALCHQRPPRVVT